MKKTFSHPVFVEKEDVSGLRFPLKEVLSADVLKLSRSVALMRAVDYGNYAHYKVAIIFKDKDGLKQVETTVWDMDERNIYLKNRVTIPIHCIIKVNL